MASTSSRCADRALMICLSSSLTHTCLHHTQAPNGALASTFHLVNALVRVRLLSEKGTHCVRFLRDGRAASYLMTEVGMEARRQVARSLTSETIRKLQKSPSTATLATSLSCRSCLTRASDSAHCPGFRSSIPRDAPLRSSTPSGGCTAAWQKARRIRHMKPQRRPAMHLTLSSRIGRIAPPESLG